MSGPAHEKTQAERIEELLEAVRTRQTLPNRERRRQIRIEAGVSLREMGAALGVSHTAVRHWETAQDPRLESVDDYRRLLDGLEEIVRERAEQ